MKEIAYVVFTISFSACLYVYLGYPALLLVLSRIWSRPVLREPLTPSLTIIIAAFNEEAFIEKKLRDTLANGYPSERLEIIVASDGSTDGTVNLIRRMGHPAVRVLALDRRGKLQALSAAAKVASGEVLVFSDADTLLAPGSLRFLAENFGDPEVGGVAGRKALRKAESEEHLGRSEGLYRRFDEWMKERESQIGSAVAADGTLYAVRRDLFDPGTDPAAADDMAISTRVVVQGYRLVYDPRATVWVEPPSNSGSELQRKVRIANQVTRALLGMGLAFWTSGFYSLELLSHKLMRYLVPPFLLLLMASSLLLAGSVGGIWTGFLLLQLFFYGLALLGANTHRHAIGNSKLLTIPFYFCLMNFAVLLALVSVLKGERITCWLPGAGPEAA
jgi:cellulose synthase/poly-beta-1,6-N-acetylglucosamine synthase-like glycosyltransferase